MSLILPTLLLAATTTAQLTTSIWMPTGYLSPDEAGYYGSVIGGDKDRLTLAITYDNDTDTSRLYGYQLTPQTITVGPTLYEAASTSTVKSSMTGHYTTSIGCSMDTVTRAKPVCTMSVGGDLAFKSYCGYYSAYTTRGYTTTYAYTYTADQYGPASTKTYTKTYDYNSLIPTFCTSGTVLPSSLAIETTTMSRSRIDTYQVVITAGQEKIGATPASVTGTQGRATGTGAQPTGSNGSPIGGPAVATGAAMPMITAAPALAGLGAAVAAFLI